MVVLTGLLALLLAAVHILCPQLRFLAGVPRSRWLSFAGGVAAGYVFLHVLPELAAHGERLAAELQLAPALAEFLIYLVALGGLAAFYGLEAHASTSRRGRSGPRADEGTAHAAMFRVHIATFGLYSFLIGYLLLHRAELGLVPLLLYFAAMALHFLAADFGLRLDYTARYDRTGRWWLAAATIAGWIIGAFFALPAAAVGLFFAFLAGGIVLNVLKEELPEERQSRLAPFLAGTAVYAALSLAP